MKNSSSGTVSNLSKNIVFYSIKDLFTQTKETIDKSDEACTGLINYKIFESNSDSPCSTGNTILAKNYILRTSSFIERLSEWSAEFEGNKGSKVILYFTGVSEDAWLMQQQFMRNMPTGTSKWLEGSKIKTPIKVTSIQGEIGLIGQSK